MVRVPDHYIHFSCFMFFDIHILYLLWHNGCHFFCILLYMKPLLYGFLIPKPVSKYILHLATKLLLHFGLDQLD
jgi:hypothetical protein